MTSRPHVARGMERLIADAGSGTGLALGVILAVITVSLGAATVAQVVAAAHTARSAADLAALAAAGAAQRGEPGCAAAARVAQAGGARLERCAVSAAGVAEVRTSVPVRTRAPGLPERASGYARAGPDGPADLGSVGRPRTG